MQGRSLQDILDFRPVPPKGRENHFLWCKELTGYLNDAYQVYLAGRSNHDMTSEERTYWGFALNLIAEITANRAEFIRQCAMVDDLPSKKP